MTSCFVRTTGHLIDLNLLFFARTVIQTTQNMCPHGRMIGMWSTSSYVSKHTAHVSLSIYTLSTLFPSAKDKRDGSFTVYYETLELRLDKALSENSELGCKFRSRLISFEYLSKLRPRWQVLMQFPICWYHLTYNKKKLVITIKNSSENYTIVCHILEQSQHKKDL